MNPISYIRPFVAAAALYVASIAACAPTLEQSKQPSAAVSPAQQTYAALEQQAVAELGIKSNKSLLKSIQVNGEYFFFRAGSAVDLLAGVCAGNGEFEVRGKDLYVVSSLTADTFDEGVEVTRQRNQVVTAADTKGNKNHITTSQEFSDLAFQIFLKGGKCE